MPLNSHPADRRRRRAGGQARGGRRPVPRRRRLLGRRGAGQPRPTCRALHDAGRLRLQVLPGRLRRAGVPAAGPGRAASALAEVAALDALLIVHAEDPALIGRAPAAAGPATPDFLASRPPEAENRGGRARLLDAARRTGARVHVAAPVRAPTRCRCSPRPARTGVRVTAETCPHYLTPDRRGGPRRRHRSSSAARRSATRANRDALWAGAAPPASIDCVVSDHSPCTPELKRLDTGDFGAAWGGIASLQLGLPVVWTAGARSAGTAWPTWCAGWRDAPGRAGRAARARADRGRAPTPTWSRSRRTRRSWSTRPGCTTGTRSRPYAGRTLRGVVRATWLRGRAGRRRRAARRPRRTTCCRGATR